MSAVAPAPRACAWCGTPVEAAGDGLVWCCPGCEGAAALVSGAGLERFFQDRTAWAPRPETAEIAWERLPVRTRPDGSCEAALHVDGLSCLACVALVEGLLGQDLGVLEAHVNHATGRTRLAWDPTKTDLPRLADRVTRLGYGLRPLASPPLVQAALLWRLGFAAFAGANLMLVHAALYLGWFEGMAPGWAKLLQWTALALATPVAWWAASPFHARAWAGLRAGVLHMDLPISLAVGVTWLHGVWATLQGQEGYFDSLGMLVALLLAGRWLEGRARRQRASAAEVLAARLPTVARRQVDGAEERVAPEALRAGDRLDVGLGEVFAADARVVTGSGRIHQALLTGEAEPVAVGPGDRVLAGTTLVAGHVAVAVERAGTATLLRRMEAALAGAGGEAEEASPTERLAPAFTATTLVVATLGGAAWAWASGPAAGLQVAVAVLVVACPCALALGGPLSALAGTAAAARGGLLVRSAGALRRLATVDRVVLDKTGTLTCGRLRVTGGSDRVLRVAAGLERASVHPIARAVRDAARDRGLALPAAEDLVERPGLGIDGRVDGRAWQLRAAGPGRVQVVGLGELVLGDRLRTEAPATVAALRAEGLAVAMLSGDHAEVAERVAAAAGIDEVVGAASPEDKQARIAAAQALGHRVLFVGDGVNDGPALTEAAVGVAMRDGAPSSVLAADAVALDDGLAPVLAGLRAARSAAASSRLALRGALVYNAVAVALALTGRVDPLVAALWMPLSNGWVLWVCGRPLREQGPLTRDSRP